jgi:prepilin-type N-terminal cleavage/methylation domain-containing protein
MRRIPEAPRGTPVVRRGYTLWELTMVLLVMAIAATLAAPAYVRFGAEQPSRGADKMLLLLREARKASFALNATVTVRVDPKTLKYQIDTTTVNGSGMLLAGTLDLGMTETLVTDKPRLLYVFRPTGSAIADTVVVGGAEVPLVVRVDMWSGVARADTL